MTVKLSPVFQEPQLDNNGNLLSGGLLYWYSSGTTTPQNTYTDSTGVTPQANPITLNSRGQPDNPIWLTTGIYYKAVLKAADGTTLQTIDNISGVNDVAQAAVSEWALMAGNATYVGATSFTVDGDKTAILTQYRRLKATVSGGEWYATIATSSYSSGTGKTTITVTNDSISLDAGLTSVYYGILSSDHLSVPSIAVFNAGANLGTSVNATLQGAWATYLGDTVRYFKDPMGMVHIEGEVTGGVAGTTIFTLPAGYRPAASYQQLVSSNTGAAPLYIGLNGTGQVSATSGTTISLYGIYFKAVS